jgi:hypothetical protein
MTGSTKLTLALALMMISAVGGCMTSQPSTATDRLKAKAAECAASLAGGTQADAREDCLAHLAELEAALNW